jgi:hypothetical protein
MAPRSIAPWFVPRCLAVTAALAALAPSEVRAAGEAPAFATDPVRDRETSATASTDDRASYDLYLRVSAGAGVVGVDMHPESGYEDYSADGASLALELLVGASPYRGAALGGALIFDLAPSMPLASRTDPNAGPDSTVAIAMLGPFFDAFPEPKWGLHLGASLGFATLSVHPEGVSRHPLYGLGGSAWAGNQFRVGKDWSMGGTLRVVQTYTGDEGGEFDFETSSLATSLLLTAAYH